MVNRGRLPTSPIQSRVRENASDYTVTRVTRTKGDMGVSVENASSSHNASLWVHSPTESIAQTVVGERTDASLMATMLPSENVEKDDRIDYDGDTYEVGPVVYYPSASNKVIKAAPLVRRHVSED